MPKLSNTDKSKYQPNVSVFLALCARNYMHILRWLGDHVAVNEPWVVTGEFGRLNVCILENTKYTQRLKISRSLPAKVKVSEPCVEVRLYHDAQLAEVLTSQQIFQLLPVYDYPNIYMHHRDEKLQVNAFLEELLKIDHFNQFVCKANP